MSDENLFGPRALAVRQFLEAIQRLTIEQWREVIEAWRTTVTDAWHDAGSAVAAAVTPATRIVFLANPHNPSGRPIPLDVLRDLYDEVADALPSIACVKAAVLE